MKLLIKNLTDILSDNLSVEERGLLITLLLVNDIDPKLTLAKFKAKVKINQFKEQLISLHEKGYIEWVGVKRANQSIEQERVSPEVIECINFFNNLCKRKFDPKSKTTTKNLRNRLLEHSVEEIKLVIANRYSNWKDDPIMSEHLNPTTLFRPSKFPKYLEAALRTKEGKGFVNAEKIDLKKGDELTFDREIINQLIDDDVYNIKVYKLRNGKRGNAKREKITGKVLKNLLNIQSSRRDRDEELEFSYIYNQ